MALRIAVADDEPDMREYFERILPRLGHEVVSVAATGTELVEHCRRNFDHEFDREQPGGVVPPALQGRGGC